MKHFLPIIIALLLPVAVTAQNRNGKENLIIKEWNVEPSSGVKVLDHETIYNRFGLKVEEAEFSKEGLKWRKKFEYSPDGVLTRVLVYNSSGKLDNIRKFEYTPTGRKHKEFIYNAKGKMSRYKIYEYSTSSGN